MTRHPARYSPQLFEIFKELLAGKTRVLDPMAGTGVRLLDLCPHACLNELEYPWACQTRRGVVGDALRLPYPTGAFEVVIVSPSYGSRMADTFTDKQPEKNYKRNTYTHALGKKLHPKNSGGMQWGERYREFHVSAWKEARRVLSLGGTFILNCKDHIRSGRRIYVTDWHKETLLALGFILIEDVQIECPGLRYGENYSARIPYESVMVFENTTYPRV